MEKGKEIHHLVYLPIIKIPPKGDIPCSVFVGLFFIFTGLMFDFCVAIWVLICFDCKTISGGLFA
jgi:hypothetical protein